MSSGSVPISMTTPLLDALGTPEPERPRLDPAHRAARPARRRAVAGAGSTLPGAGRTVRKIKNWQRLLEQSLDQRPLCRRA